MKNLKRWHYPTSIPEALECLSAGDGRVKLIGGGTALAESRALDVEGLVDITRIPELQEISVAEDGRCTLGAAVTARDLMTATLPELVADLLGEAAGTISHHMHRNVITVGGNIVQLYPWSDMPVALLALDAVYTVQSVSGGARRLPALELTTRHPKKTLLPNEMLTTIDIPAAPPATGGAFLKFARTESDYAFATAAARVTLDASARLADCRIVVGGALARPERLSELETQLRGKALTESLAEEIAAKVGDFVTPMNDFRVSVAYRSELCSVLVKRALLASFERAKRTDSLAADGRGA